MFLMGPTLRCIPHHKKSAISFICCKLDCYISTYSKLNQGAPRYGRIVVFWPRRYKAGGLDTGGQDVGDNKTGDQDRNLGIRNLGARKTAARNLGLEPGPRSLGH